MKVESTRIVNNKESTHKRIYISSLTDDCPQKYANLILEHWGIGNGLHWHLDLTFREDDSRVRKDNGPMNLNIFRFSSYNIIKELMKKTSTTKRLCVVVRFNLTHYEKGITIDKSQMETLRIFYSKNIPQLSYKVNP